MSILSRAINSITKISDDDSINFDNFRESLDYISNLYGFLNELSSVVNPDKLKFLPSFKGKYISERLGIATTDKENELKYIKIKSQLFLDNKGLVFDIKEKMKEICTEIIVVDDIMIFCL